MGRIVRGTIYRGGDTPWTNARILFDLKKGSFTANRQYPQDRIIATTNGVGYFEVELWTNAQGFRPSEWRCKLPDNEEFNFILPIGSTPIDLSELRAATSWSPPLSLAGILDQYFLTPTEGGQLIAAAIAAITPASISAESIAAREFSPTTIDPGNTATFTGAINFLLQAVRDLQNAAIPQNFVTYNGQTLTHNGQPLTYTP